MNQSVILNKKFYDAAQTSKATSVNTHETADIAITADADELFRLGIKHASEQQGRGDLIDAHKWFNLAATLGSKQAISARQEMAVQMTDKEIALAQRKARQWLLSTNKTR